MYAVAVEPAIADIATSHEFMVSYNSKKNWIEYMLNHGSVSWLPIKISKCVYN